MAQSWAVLLLMLAAVQWEGANAELADQPEWIACAAAPEACTTLLTWETLCYLKSPGILRATASNDRRYSLVLSVTEVYSRIIAGTIPSEIGLFTNLERLSLYNAQVNGSIPKEIGNLQKLTLFNVHNNYISGKIPSEMGNMTSLVHFYAYSNFLSGRLPSELGLLPALEALFLSKNFIRGTIPTTFGNLTKLYQFSLHRNNLTGPVPSELAMLSQLNVFFLSKNQLSGSIPPEVIETMNTQVKRWSFCDNEDMEFQELTMIDSGNKTLLCAYDSTSGTEQQRRHLLSSDGAPRHVSAHAWMMGAFMLLCSLYV